MFLKIGHRSLFPCMTGLYKIQDLKLESISSVLTWSFVAVLSYFDTARLRRNLLSTSLIGYSMFPSYRLEIVAHLNFPY